MYFNFEMAMAIFLSNNPLTSFQGKGRKRICFCCEYVKYFGCVQLSYGSKVVFFPSPRNDPISKETDKNIKYDVSSTKDLNQESMTNRISV